MKFQMSKIVGTQNSHSVYQRLEVKDADYVQVSTMKVTEIWEYSIF